MLLTRSGIYAAWMESLQDKPAYVAIADEDLEKKVGELLNVFHKRRLASLQGLELKRKLKAKNPYLVRAIGVADAGEIVAQLLDAHISSSDETIFGNEFFEPLAKWVASAASKGVDGVTVQVSGAEGCDILYVTNDRDEAIAVKSGTKVFNAQSRGKQKLEFEKIERILKKNKKIFVALVGYCYGNKREGKNRHFVELAGQTFWKHLSDDEQLYTRIISAMGDKPASHRSNFEDEYNKAKNRFAKAFLDEYANADGSINWEKVATLTSGHKEKKHKKAESRKARRGRGTSQI